MSLHFFLCNANVMQWILQKVMSNILHYQKISNASIPACFSVLHTRVLQPAQAWQRTTVMQSSSFSLVWRVACQASITINMLAKKFWLFGTRESEVKYGKPSSQNPKSLNLQAFCKNVFNFLGFCDFPFYFFSFI